MLRLAPTVDSTEVGVLEQVRSISCDRYQNPYNNLRTTICVQQSPYDVYGQLCAGQLSLQPQGQYVRVLSAWKTPGGRCCADLRIRVSRPGHPEMTLESGWFTHATPFR